MSEEILEIDDIQGLVLRGYGPLAAARFLLLEVADDERARAYLRGLCGRVNRALDSPETYAIQVAFTASGLARLGVPDRGLATFSREFLEGMDEGVRADTLGDRGRNDPSSWEWGRHEELRDGSGPLKRKQRVHVLLMIYALDEPTLEIPLTSEQKAIAGAFNVLHEKKTISLAAQREHFGWVDGLSMPKIAGVPVDRPRGKAKRADGSTKPHESWTEPIPAGEFVLGYRNDYNAFTESPMVAFADDPANHLSITADGMRKDLGRNGTYLVYREMTQDVLAFWDYLATESRESGADLAARAIALGAKMVGRWPSGAPLITSPDADRPEQAATNTFTFDKDRAGTSCPHGAHIRRANPRDVLAVEDRGPETSIQMVRKHQMIRRGRPFGRPVSEQLDPREILAARGKPDGERRGLHFICLVGNINRQFEFVQRSWIHSANFDSLFKDGDPIAAARHGPGAANPNDDFTCPAAPVRRKYKKMPQFTQLVGGGYFFLPGIAALRFIARHP